MSLNEDAERQMGVEEMILRLLSFNFSEKPLKHEVREYLDDFMAIASEGKFTLSAELEEKIISVFAITNQALPHGGAFRFPKQGFSTNLFDIVATRVFHNLDSLTPEIIARKWNELQQSYELKTLTGAGSNTRKKLQGRLELGKRWFSV